jgi:hypothetical protein
MHQVDVINVAMGTDAVNGEILIDVASVPSSSDTNDGIRDPPIRRLGTWGGVIRSLVANNHVRINGVMTGAVTRIPSLVDRLLHITPMIIAVWMARRDAVAPPPPELRLTKEAIISASFPDPSEGRLDVTFHVPMVSIIGDTGVEWSFTVSLLRRKTASTDATHVMRSELIDTRNILHLENEESRRLLGSVTDRLAVLERTLLLTPHPSIR